MKPPHHPLTYTRMMIRSQRRYDRLQALAPPVLRSAARPLRPQAPSGAEPARVIALLR